MRRITIEQVNDGLHRAGNNSAQIVKFVAWYKSAPEVWANFERITLDLINRRKKAGAIDIMARVRWECEIEGGKDYKVNNNYAPYLARVFVLKYPEHKGFFEFREVGERDAA